MRAHTVTRTISVADAASMILLGPTSFLMDGYNATVAGRPTHEDDLTEMDSKVVEIFIKHGRVDVAVERADSHRPTTPIEN